MNYNRGGTGDMLAIKNDGTLVQPDSDGQLTLGVGTYYVPFGAPDSAVPEEVSLVSLHLAWAAAVAAAITVEASNLSPKRGGGFTGPDDVSDYDETAGNWIPWDPSDAESAAAGTGNSATGATLTAGGTNAGGGAIELPDFGFRRGRLKIVTTVGGKIRIAARGKLGS